MRGLSQRARKAALVTVGVVLLVVGAIMVPLPTPSGAPIMAVGLILLVGVSATARRVLRRARQRWRLVDRACAMVEARVGRASGTMLKRTRPLSRKQEARKMEAKAALSAADAALKRTRLEGNGGASV